MADENDRDDLRRFDYERGEGRVKHCWRNDYAGFSPSKRGPVGKCHAFISDSIAMDLLRNGVVEADPFSGMGGTADIDGHTGNADESFPEKIFNVYRGVPYVAVPTQPGKSYHGYPWRGRMSASIREKLSARAEADGELKRFKRWLKKYGE